MRGFTRFITVFIAFSSMPVVKCQDIFAGYENLFTPPRQYVAFQAIGSIKIDGKPAEASWELVPWSDYFTDIEGSLKPSPPFKTRFKILWDQKYLYLLAEMEEPDIWASIKKRDEVIFYDNDFEVFLDPDGDTQNYFEIEVNAFNTIFDLFLPKPYRNGGPALLNWDMPNLRSAVSVQGTINHSNDVDQKWMVEMALPFSSMSLGDKIKMPKDKSTWRINFSRIEWNMEVVKENYVKVKDPVTHRHLPEHNWVWSPQGVVNMHLPERWGYLHFSTAQPSKVVPEVALPVTEGLKKYLWLLFYKQQEYRQLHEKYATELAQINFPALIELPGINCTISLEAISNQYRAVITLMPEGESWQINQDGKINKVSKPWSIKDNL